LADFDPKWRPVEYHHRLWGTEAGLTFRAAKLLDYRDRWGELEVSRNPFATAVMAHLKAQVTAKDGKERLRWKLILAKMLFGKGYKRSQVIELFRFMDYVLALPQDLEIGYETQMADFEEGSKLTYLSRFEQRAMERGIEQGIDKGIEKGIEQGVVAAARQSVVDVLETRFIRVPRRIIAGVNRIADVKKLRALVRTAAVVENVKEFERHLSA